MIDRKFCATLYNSTANVSHYKISKWPLILSSYKPCCQNDGTAIYAQFSKFVEFTNVSLSVLIAILPTVRFK